MAGAFALTALVLLPWPTTVAVGLTAALAGAGGGVAGRRRRGAGSFVALAGGLAAAQCVAGFLPALPPGTAGELLGLGLLFVVVQTVAGLLGILVAPEEATGLSIQGQRRVFLVEFLAVPLAWLLAGRLREGAWLEAVAIAGCTAVAGVVLAGLFRNQLAFRRSRTQLHSRLAELETLHTIGREVLSCLDPQRVFAVVDRECRKVLVADRCVVALVGADGSSLTTVFASDRPPSTLPVPHPDGLVQLVFASRQATAVRDAHALPPRDEARLGHAASRAGLAAPLIVEGHVIGVLSFESRQPARFDKNHVALLTTIAQQAAIAIENSRNYQRATIDTLTGFYSRDYFFRRLDEEQRRQDRYGNGFAVMMIDLDDFKSVNDRHGHLAGDRCLTAVAGTIRAALRDADIPCRYGGDEFCVLLPETGIQGAHAIAERIRAAVDRAAPAEESALRATISVGVAAFPPRTVLPLEGLLRRADEALYRAKRDGRNRVVPSAA